MGKFKNNKHWKNKSQAEQQPKKEGESAEQQPQKHVKTTVDEEHFDNPIFERYYKEQLKYYFLQEQQDIKYSEELEKLQQKEWPQKAQKEWEFFWNTMKAKLPSSFRVNSNIPNSDLFVNQIDQGDSFLLNLLQQSQKEESEKIQQKQQQNQQQQQQQNRNSRILDCTLEELLKIVKQTNFQPVQWMPSAYQMDIDRQTLLKTHQKFHQMIDSANDYGMISRQELVSMIPPVFLSPEPSDLVLDMCAAPGSKTVQLIEIMQKKADLQHQQEQQNIENKNSEQHKYGIDGCVIANDVITNRSHLLSSRINITQTEGQLVINHQAQFLPNIWQSGDNLKNNIKFDKILADVPCTGDGAVRKISNKWALWGTIDGFSMFQTQLSILMRSLQLAKKDGIVAYSTCSISPIEDEAVVLEAIRKSVPGSLEIIDCHKIISEKMPGFIGRKGLKKWKVLLSTQNKQESGKSNEELNQMQFGELFEEIPSFASLEGKHFEGKKEQRRYLQQGMWPESEEFMTKVGIENTVRVLPHDQNTGGFYIALLKKKSDIVFVQDQKFDIQQHLNAIQNNQNSDSVQLEEDLEINRKIIHSVDSDRYHESVLLKLKEKDQRRIQKREVSLQLQKQQQKEENFKLEEDQEQIKKKLKTENSEQNINEDNNNIEQEEEKENKIDDKSSKEFLAAQRNKKKQKKEQEFTQFFEQYQTIADDDYLQLKELFGLQNLEKEQLIVGNKGTSQTRTKVKFISKSLVEVLKNPQNQENINIVNTGCRAFQKTQQNDYRLSQDALRIMFPHITKRKMKTGLKNILYVVGKQCIKYEDIPDQQFVTELKTMGNGPCLLYSDKYSYDKNEENCEFNKIKLEKEFISIQIYPSSIQPMVSTQDVKFFKILYQNLLQ